MVNTYEEATNWYTRQHILSLFATDHSKTELLALIPGPSKLSIDKARKQAFQTKPGQLIDLLPRIDPSKINRCHLDAVKIDHLVDFLSSASFLQDVT